MNSDKDIQYIEAAFPAKKLKGMELRTFIFGNGRFAMMKNRLKKRKTILQFKQKPVWSGT